MLCAYPTVKYVQIQDSRLVILRYTLLVVIVVYVIFFEMIFMGGWLDPSPVVGVVRFSLQQPTVDNCDPSQPGCDNAFSSLDTLPYCQQYYQQHNITTQTYPGEVYPCEFYEAINAQVINEKSLTVITRASTIPQTFVCPANASNSTCPKTYENTGPEKKFYTVQSEAFTVMIDHAVTASKICTRHHAKGLSNKPNYACSAEAAAYQGRLYSKNSQLCQREHDKGNAFEDYRGNTPSPTAPCYINPNRTKTSNQDFFSLDVLLQAAGIDMDDCNQSVAEVDDDSSSDNNSTCQTYRDSGATLLLNIYWSDFVPYHGVVAPHYYYSPQLVARSSFKQYLSFYDNNYREKRTLLNAHGIRLAVLLGGEFNQFNVITFLVTLTTALGLLAVATTIVDSLMLYILPEKERYLQAKYESTETIFESDNVVTSAVEGLSHLLVPRQERRGQRSAVSFDGNDQEHSQPQQQSVDRGEDTLREPLLSERETGGEQSDSSGLNEQHTQVALDT